MSTVKKVSEIAVSASTPATVLTADSSGNVQRTTPSALPKVTMTTSAIPGNDIDSLVTPGLYHLTGESTGTFPHGNSKPYRWAILEVIVRASDIYQRFTEVDRIAVRRGDALRGTWTDWREVLLTTASS